MKIASNEYFFVSVFIPLKIHVETYCSNAERVSFNGQPNWSPLQVSALQLSN